MKCALCPVALVALSALAGGSLVALTQPDGTAHKSQPTPAKDRPGQPGGDPAHPLTNMPNSDGPKGQPDMQEAMKQAQERLKPGPNIKFLENWIGKWDTTSKMYPAPGAAAIESHGHSEYKWAIEGHWLEERFDGQIMGTPHKGVGLTGYDSFNKQFTGCWADNFNPAMINLGGSLDASGKVLTMFGKMDEPTTGEHGKTFRFQTTLVDQDTRKMTIDDLQSGQNITIVEVTYKRAK
jgi:Protein of unknown function (DUF1579)